MYQLDLPVCDSSEQDFDPVFKFNLMFSTDLRLISPSEINAPKGFIQRNPPAKTSTK
jgi:hypothetical protein